MDLLETVFEYMRALDDGDPSGAASCFALDALMFRPEVPAQENLAFGPLVRLEGRDEIARYLTARGQRPWRHHVARVIQAESEGMIELFLTVEERVISYSIVSVSLNTEGLIRRYVGMPPVPMDASIEGALRASMPAQ